MPTFGKFGIELPDWLSLLTIEKHIIYFRFWMCFSCDDDDGDDDDDDDDDEGAARWSRSVLLFWHPVSSASDNLTISAGMGPKISHEGAQGSMACTTPRLMLIDSCWHTWADVPRCRCLTLQYIWRSQSCDVHRDAPIVVRYLEFVCCTQIVVRVSTGAARQYLPRTAFVGLQCWPEVLARRARQNKWCSWLWTAWETFPGASNLNSLRAKTNGRTRIEKAPAHCQQTHTCFEIARVRKKGGRAASKTQSRSALEPRQPQLRNSMRTWLCTSCFSSVCFL